MKTLLLLLLFLIPQSLGIMKMIQIFGKVTYGPFPVAAPSSANCASDCFDLDYCILSWQTPEGSCYHYSYLNRSDTITVVETDKIEGSKVGFKTNIAGTSCPSHHTDMDFKMTISTGDTYSWQKSENSWSLNGCRDGWKRFDRVDGVSVYIGTDQIGVASVEESKWIHEHMMQYNPNKREPFALWISGSFYPNNCDSDSFCERGIWNDNYTTGNAAFNTSTNFDCKCGYDMCPVVAFMPINDKTITSVSCSSLAAGYVCGYDLKKSV
ncbi:unnamed protein product [Caenorhabditis nigoni]